MSDQTKKKNCECSKENLQKLRILCIHGYRQNGEVFKQKTGSFRKIVHKWVEFTYITAPHKVFMVDDLSKINDLDLNECPNTEEYGWFFNRDDRTFRGIRKGGPAIGFEESVQIVEDTFKEHGPFDGILGFSQGGCFVGLLCDLQQRNLLNFKFDFVVIASGFKSGSLPHLKYYTDILNLPSLHIYGENDNIIPTEMSIELRDCFEDAAFVTHPGGHYLPASAPQKKGYQQFFKLQFSRKQCISDENLYVMSDLSKKCRCSDENLQKMRILCLHGYGQNSDVFKEHTSSFRKIVQKWAEFTYITAPHNINEFVIGECSSREEYGWFFNRDDRTFQDIRIGGPAIGFEESIKLIENTFREVGPFDGILGFSQGGCLVGLLCDLQQRNPSGFKSGSLPHSKYYNDLLNLPSLHIYGENDNKIPKEMSIQLRDCFEDAVFVTHSSGHYLPTSTFEFIEYRKFFELLFSRKRCVDNESLQ